MALPAAGAALSAVRTVGGRAVQWASQNAPDVLAKAKEYLNKSSGGNADAMLTSKNPQTNAAVVKALFEHGMSASNFAEVTQLTPEEARQYAQMVASYQVKQAQAVDSNQVARSVGGSAVLEQIQISVEIDKMLKILGVSSDQYGFIIRCLHTHRSTDIEMYQLDRQMRNQPYR